MSVYSIAKDIRETAGERLKALGIRVVEYTPEDDGEDYEVCFRRSDRRSLIVSLKLRAHGLHAGDWSDVQGIVEVYRDDPLPGTNVRFRGYAGIQSFVIDGNLSERVAAIIDKIEETGLAVVPVDVLDEGVVTSLKFFEALKSLKELEEILTGIPKLTISNEKLEDGEGIYNVARLYCDDVEYMRVTCYSDKIVVTNAMNGQQDVALHIDDMKKKIKDVALTSYAAAPRI